ncbi:MAG: hypothetical protein MJA29_01435 [Candidatus Omnitrophica bacterium]|nr:hypothetical protein [Candidatus Omnitrophota bacterium]
MIRHWKVHLPFFEVLTSPISPSQKKALVELITTDQLKALSELVYSVLTESIPIKTGHKEGLLRHKTLWILLADKRVSLKEKKEKLKVAPLIRLLQAVNLQ